MPQNPKLPGVGPFAKAAKNIEDLANNLYFNTLYIQTLEQLQKAEKEYEAAVLEGDMGAIQQTLSELNFIEEIIKLSAINYGRRQETELIKEKGQ